MDQWGDFSVTKIATSVVLALLISFMFWKITYFPFPQKVLRRVPGISLLSSGQMIIPPFVIKPKRNMSPELIPNLPTELLELIFKQTTWDALKACSLVCRRWNDLTRSWPIFPDLTFVLDNRYQREKRDGSQIVLHHRSTLRPRRVTLVCNSLPYVTGIALMNGGWFQEVRFSSIYSLRLRGVLTEKMKWASASLVFYIIELDLGLQFFESVHSLFHLISSFEVLETLRIACRSPWPATSQFQAQHCVPQGRISPLLRSLYFGGNSAFLFPYFATWFSLVGGLHRQSRSLSSLSAQFPPYIHFGCSSPPSQGPYNPYTSPSPFTYRYHSGTLTSPSFLIQSVHNQATSHDCRR
ncbi:hypothetical protein BDN72DRAFT_835700 [Pluteus cervinus]|uniref:Uncharacterized protein n=1 Tax=Pluteus cervinus TaxID=181527 RepID=A0ACD3B423_9AGAR|nr:hypothetical protein BDN72DRAFT_835700 [Pluteus cervinus]